MKRAPGRVRVEVDGAIGTLTLDRPPLNILDDPMRATILAALADFEARCLRAVVLAAAGARAFCAGADLADEQDLTPGTVRAFVEADEAVLAALDGYPGAVVAAVGGGAHGGGLELALACDIRIAARSARFAAAGVGLGLVASTARLPRLVGEGVAADLLLTGRTVGADEALALGLVSRVVEDADLLVEARRWADTVASRAPLSVQANKVALRYCARLPLDEAVEWERSEWARLQRTHDHREAVHAFFEKRPPAFRGE